MKRSIIVLCALIFIGANCERKPVVIVPEDTHKCPEACSNLRSLGCEEGQDLEDGTTCEDFCRETQERGHALNPTCLATVKSCAEVEDKCFQ